MGDDLPAAEIRCICGRRYTLKIGEEVSCKCGAKVELQGGEHCRPWAWISDGYDLAKRKFNQPKIMRWQ